MGALFYIFIAFCRFFVYKWDEVTCCWVSDVGFEEILEWSLCVDEWYYYCEGLLGWDFVTGLAFLY